MQQRKAARAQPSSGSIANTTYWWYRARSRLLYTVLGPLVLPGSTLVDVGSADGPSVAWLDHVARRIPLDVDPAGLRPGGVCASALALPFADAGLDAVSAFDVIEHFPDDAALARELHRVVRPGGRLLVSVPAYQWAWSSFDVRAGHYRRYSRRDIVRVLEDADFRVERATHAFAASLPLFAADRLRARLLRRDSERVADSILPGWAQAVLLGLARVDEALLRRWRLPFGSSIIVAATRPGARLDAPRRRCAPLPTH